MMNRVYCRGDMRNDSPLKAGENVVFHDRNQVDGMFNEGVRSPAQRNEP